MPPLREQLVLTRDVTQNECPWLDMDMPAGKIVFRFYGATYGCIGWHGTACSEVCGENPFFELPTDALAVRPLIAGDAA